MPIHDTIASRLPLLDGIGSFADVMADPDKRRRFDDFGRMGSTPAADLLVDAGQAPGPHGPVPVRLYRPVAAGSSRPALIWLHGGAFLGGDLDMPEADWVAREIADRAGAVVVSVDYRLAVGDVCYPVPHDDAVAAVRWVRDHAVDLGIDPARITLGGASAGGNLAAGAGLRLRDDENWLPATLCLVYATTHAVVPPLSAGLEARMREVPRLLRFLPEDRHFITTNYLGGPESTADGYAMPANAVLDGLCPVVMVNAEYDDLRASSEAFAAQLAVAGVDVRQVLVPGMLHGFLNLTSELGPVDGALALMADVVARAGATSNELVSA